MSTRDHPDWLNAYLQAARAAGVPSDLDHILVLPVFELGFEQPLFPESTDLYELDLATGAVRRLTTDGDDGWIIPEFAWDPTHSLLMWTEGKFQDEVQYEPGESIVTLAQQVVQVLGGIRITAPPAGGNLLSLFPLVSRTRIMRFDLGSAAAP